MAVLLAHTFHPTFGSMSLLALIAATWILVLAHESGHAVAARASGYRVPRMAVYPIYGVTTVQRPRQSTDGSVGYLVTIVAGPAAGALAALFALAALSALGSNTALPGFVEEPALRLTLAAGLIDQVGNLLPIHRVFDGARAIRELAGIRARREAEARIRHIRHANAASIPAPPSESTPALRIRRAA